MLLERGDQHVLLAEGPCRLDRRIRNVVLGLIRRRYPFARSLADDLASDVELGIFGGGAMLVPGTIRHLPVLERRLYEMARTGLIDALRHHRLVTRVRCGACVHFGSDPPPAGCHLPLLPDLGTEARPNPWYGAELPRTTDPRQLAPPCEAFTWRRPEQHDLFAEQIPGVNPEGTPRERALALLIEALDRLARRDARGLLAAAAVFWHHLRGKPLAALAAEHHTSEKTIQRLLAEGREDLLGILQRELQVEDPAEILQ